MLTAATPTPEVTARHPMQGGWDELFLRTRTNQKPGIHVVAPELDAELHIETTTIMFADVVESVRLIEQDESANVRRIRSLLKRLAELAALKYSGVVLERRGDGLLIKFADGRCAAACALSFHSEAALINHDVLPNQVIALRVGVHQSEFLSDTTSMYGRGMNTAARLAALAGPNETVMSQNARDELTAGLDGEFEDLGDCYLKHQSIPLRSYRMSPSTNGSAPAGNFRAAAGASVKPQELRATIAILPFQPYETKKGTGRRPFGVGDVLTDQVVVSLSRSSNVNMISRLSTNAFRDRDATNAVVHESLKADYIVTGRYVVALGKLTLWIELSQATSGQIVWADQCCGREDEALSIDSDLVRGIVDRIARAILSSELVDVRAMPLPNLPSYTLYLSAVSLLHRFSLADFDRSRQILEVLHERAPRHPAPLAWLARWHVFRVVQGWSISPDDDRKRGLNYSDRALDLDPESTLALTVAGSVRVNLGKQLDEAIALYDRALTINPNEGLAWLLKGTAQAFQVKTKEAISCCDKATHLSPLDPVRFLYDSLGASVRVLDQDYDGAISFAQRSLRANSRHASSWRALAIAQVLKGELGAAKATIMQLLRLEPGSTVSRFMARAPVSDPEIVHRYAMALREAGLPA